MVVERARINHPDRPGLCPHPIPISSTGWERLWRWERTEQLALKTGALCWQRKCEFSPARRER